MARKDKENKKSAWNPEQEFDLATTLAELINEPPFKEVSGGSGESMTAGTRIPMWLHRRVMRLKEFPSSPYDLASDVLRDAVYIGMRVLNMRYKMNPDWNVESKMASIVDFAAIGQRLKQQVRALSGGLDDLWKEGDEDKATESLSKYIKAAIELDQDWYRKKLFGMLKNDKTIQVILKSCPPEIMSIVEEESR